MTDSVFQKSYGRLIAFAYKTRCTTVLSHLHLMLVVICRLTIMCILGSASEEDLGTSEEEGKDWDALEKEAREGEEDSSCLVCH